MSVTHVGPAKWINSYDTPLPPDAKLPDHRAAFNGADWRIQVEHLERQHGIADPERAAETLTVLMHGDGADELASWTELHDYWHHHGGL